MVDLKRRFTSDEGETAVNCKGAALRVKDYYLKCSLNVSPN